MVAKTSWKILLSGAGGFERQRGLKKAWEGVWNVIAKVTASGKRVFRSKKKDDPPPKTGGWEELDALGDKAAVDALVAEANNAERLFEAQAKATTGQAAAVDSKTALEIANRRLDRARRGESPDPKPTQPKPESKPTSTAKDDGTPPKGEGKPAEPRKADAEQPKAEPRADRTPDRTPDPEPKSRKQRKVEGQRLDIESEELSQQLAEMKNRVKKSKIKRYGKWLLLGGSGWYLKESGQEFFRKNPDKWDAFKSEADKLFAGDWTAVPNLAAKVLSVTPGVVGGALGTAYKDIKAGYKNLQQAGSEAYKAAQEAAKDTTVRGTESPSYRSKVVLDKPPASTVTPKVRKTDGPKTQGPDFKNVPRPREKPALPTSEVSLADATTNVAPGSSVVSKLNQKSKKVTKAKKKPPRFSEEAGVEWFKKRGIKAEYDWNFPEDRKVRKGGEITSDSYKLRKKPKTTSEVKKGSRQSRSWNY